jgi:hypothetical protein
MDSTAPGKCIYPQISYLNEIYDEDSSAIFLLPFRNVSDWIRSITNWPTLRQRMTDYCEFPEYNFTFGMGKEDREMEDLYCKHVQHIRQFASRRPNLSLVEYSIDGEGVGDYLAAVLPHMNLNGSNYGHTNKIGDTWFNSDCFKPLTRPRLGAYKKWKKSNNISPPTIVNVGFPKVWSTTLEEFLSTSGFNVSHTWPCGGQGKGDCASCMQQAINKSLPPLAYCGNYAAYTQMDITAPGKCIYPQISYLKQIYDEDTSAIFLLPFRNVTDWIRSVSNWPIPGPKSLRQRMTDYCEFPEYNFTMSMGNDDRELEDLYCRHVQHIRHFVSQRPNLTLVEYSIDGEGVGDYLASLLPHMKLNGSNYGHMNKSHMTRKNSSS